MDSLATSVAAIFEFPIDFAGQKKAHDLISRCLSLGVLASIVAGIFTNSIHALVYTFAASLVITFVAVVPAWPAFKQNPQSFLPVKYDL